MKKLFLLCLSLFVFVNQLFPQDCPKNIGFELGNFTNWTLYTGSVRVDNQQNNIIQLSNSSIINNRHSIMSSKTQKDPYGNFPVLAPNGSSYSVKLGNDGTGAQAEGIKYKFKVPSNNPEFTLSYQYAVVFEDPSHPAFQQPRFTAKVLDVESNTYIQCASFEYIATANLPGFYKSSTKNNVWYKDWSTVTINLSGYQGKEISLEFTTADCTVSGHFGYAYVDINEDCTTAIQGNTVCSSANSFTLKGPAGYKDYTWYNEDKTIKYGTGEQLTFNKLLKDGSKVIVDLVPYSGFGCPNTVSTIIKLVNFELKTVSNVNTCIDNPVDILSDKIILNKNTNTTYTCFEDANLTKQVLNTNKILKSGTYYIKASSAGCIDIKPVKVMFEDYFSTLQIKSPLMICSSELANLTNPNLFVNLPQDAKITCFFDKNLNNTIPDASKVKAGTYYLKITKGNCSTIKEVTVSNYPEAVLKITNPNPFCLNTTADLTNPVFYIGSSSNLTYSFYEDAALLKQIDNPKLIKNSGKYYIKAINSNGCSTIGAIDILFENPILKASNPSPVCFPETVDITNVNLYNGTTQGVSFKYYNLDNTPLNNPKTVKLSGKYIVEINNNYGCADRKEIEVVINDLPIININPPKKILEPSTIDLTNPSIINGSSGFDRVNFFEDEYLTIPVKEPKKVSKSGEYFVVLYTRNGCFVKQKVNIVIGKNPQIAVPTAFTPLNTHNNKIFPFILNVNKLISFKIYNKWGNLVYQTSSFKPEDGWDGYFKGKLQPYETYTWYIEAINEIDEKISTKGQFIMIL